MKTFLAVSFCFLSAALAAGADEYPALGPDIYDTHASGTALIGAALAQARVEHKIVLIVFGANWCPWCRKLDATMKSNRAVITELEKSFIVVLVDLNLRHGKRNAEVNARYGNPLQEGLPVLVVLDASGKQLTTQESGALEEGDHHDPQKIVAFLRRCEPSKNIAPTPP